jgi:CBS domain-containing protein
VDRLRPAAGFGLIALLMGEFGITGLTQDVLVWLAIINTALAVFNLVPAAPLDGGRILRAFLWMRRGDRTSAAVTAARAGRVFGLVLVGLGLAEIVLVPGLAGLWLMLIGWFITGAAGVEEQHANLQRRVGGLKVADVMTAEPLSIPAGTDLQEALDRYLLQHRFTSFPVVDRSGAPRGLLTLNRVKRVPDDERARTTVEEVACPLEELPEADPDAQLMELLPRMRGCADGRALVIGDGRVVGIVSPSDVARSIDLAELRPYVTREPI